MTVAVIALSTKLLQQWKHYQNNDWSSNGTAILIEEVISGSANQKLIEIF